MAWWLKIHLFLKFQKKKLVPKYVYFCKECEGTFELKHSLQETCIICELCKVEDKLERRPSTVFISKKQSNLPGKTKPGSVMKTMIEETREELRDEQDRLTKREYKNDK